MFAVGRKIKDSTDCFTILSVYRMVSGLILSCSVRCHRTFTPTVVGSVSFMVCPLSHQLINSVFLISLRVFSQGSWLLDLVSFGLPLGVTKVI